jgi:hypothetical protein
LKKTALHIILPLILISNLLFSQVGINLLHTNHFSKSGIALSKGQTSVHKHVEHCKVCALDILFNLFYTPSSPTTVASVADSFIVSIVVEARIIFVSFSQGRAPPIV